MRRFILHYLFTGFFIIVLSSCKHETDVAMNPIVSFTNEIKPILNNNCTQSGCHGSENFTKIQLLTYDDVIKNGGVGDGNALGTKLYKRITGKGADIMPPSSPLNDLDIKRILLWIQQGAKNN